MIQLALGETKSPQVKPIAKKVGYDPRWFF
jgi:hypothetical protein